MVGFKKEMKLENWIFEIFEIDISFYYITLDNRQK